MTAGEICDWGILNSCRPYCVHWDATAPLYQYIICAAIVLSICAAVIALHLVIIVVLLVPRKSVFVASSSVLSSSTSFLYSRTKHRRESLLILVPEIGRISKSKETQSHAPADNQLALSHLWGTRTGMVSRWILCALCVLWQDSYCCGAKLLWWPCRLWYVTQFINWTTPNLELVTYAGYRWQTKVIELMKVASASKEWRRASRLFLKHKIKEYNPKTVRRGQIIYAVPEAHTQNYACVNIPVFWSASVLCGQE